MRLQMCLLGTSHTGLKRHPQLRLCPMGDGETWEEFRAAEGQGQVYMSEVLQWG